MKRLPVAAAVAVAAAAALLGVGGARGTATHGGATANVYVVDLSTLHATRVTHNADVPDDDRVAYDPGWSADGNRIAFSETRCHSCASAIYVTGVHPRSRPWLTGQLAIGTRPAFSPDGRRIAFVTARGEIWTMRVDGTHRKRVVAGGLENDSPSWSPDGRRIAFVRHETPATWSIYIVGADGKRLHELTRGPGSAIDPWWSRDGKTIAVARQRRVGEPWSVYAAAPDGSALRVLVRSSESDTAPTLSPDGRRVAFVRGFGSRTAVFVADVGSRKARRVTPWDRAALQPAWSPTRPNELAYVGRELD